MFNPGLFGHMCNRNALPKNPHKARYVDFPFGHIDIGKEEINWRGLESFNPFTPQHPKIQS